MSRAEAESAIKAYSAADEAANGKPIYHVWYDMGWVRLRTEPHGYVHRRRLKEIEAMTAELLARVSP